MGGLTLLMLAHFAAVNPDEALAVRPLEIVVPFANDIGHPRLGLSAHSFGNLCLRPAHGLQVEDECFPVHTSFNRNCAYWSSANALGTYITIAI